MFFQSNESRKTIIAQLEKQGVSQVKTLIAAGKWPDNFMPATLDWLKSKEDEATSFQSTSHLEMASTASRAATAAERAATAAEAQAVAAVEQAQIAHKALITARIAAAIGAIALISSIIPYLLRTL
ncbi:hypothetical protein M2418_002128 [Rhizobium sp. BIGb0125]|uniref:hypothetical protein n=1 Tax=Rhizobium sp. BIGb0125 TaxID=2940618 RepID=UPI002168CEF5|nr:hypothetical protein [Rhizobium sp. BIGb0125]MCS4242602.1 hypothetical protein [Rhizobium sp. BIGb0125]